MELSCVDMQQTVTILLKTMPSPDQQKRIDKLERAKRHSFTVYFTDPDTKERIAALADAEKRSASNWLRVYFLDELEGIIEQKAKRLAKKTG